MKVSIIVPVYKAEKYIRRCLDSIVAQTMQDWECILVDDGSPDKCGEICDEYASKDSQFRVIHKENGGVSRARNIGIDMAQGEWLMFIDADDEITSNALQQLSIGFGDSFDMIIGGYEKIDENGKVMSKNDRNEVLTWDMKTCLRDVYRSHCSSYNGYCFNRLFRSKKVKENKLRFCEDIFSREDALFLIQYLLKCSGLALYSLNTIYKYRQHSGNATSSFTVKYNPKIITGLDSHLACIYCIKHESKDKLLLKYARKGLISSFRWNYLQLKKFDIKDINYYLQIVKKLFKGVNMFQYLLYQLEDKVPVYLHPITQIYRKSNLRCSYLDKYLSIKKE